MPIINLVYEAPLEWKPGANTIAYFPFETDKSNQISGGPTISSSDLAVTILNGVKCLYLDGASTQTLSMGARTADYMSVMVRVYPTNNVTSSGLKILTERKVGSGYDQARNMQIDPNLKLTYNRYQSALADISVSTVSLNQWHCVGWTEDSSGAKVFLDGNTSPVGTNSSTRTFPNLTDNVGIFCYLDNGTKKAPSYGYVSKLVIMNAAITVTDFLDFYNQTKSDYGL